MVFIISVCMY